jgi:glycosyltransferase involved in cell wall biosynthesis
MLGTLLLKSRPAKTFHTFHSTLVFPVHLRKTYSIILPRLDGIFVVNDIIREQLNSLQLVLPPIYTLSSGVDLDFFDIAAEQTATRALMIGRLVPVKGFDIGIRAAAALYREGVITGVDIVGEGPEDAALRELALSQRLPVQFHGYLSKSALARVCHTAGLLVCPSRTLPGHAEATPTVILEAWAAGIPVVASTSGGIPQLIKDGVDGILAPEENVDALVAAAKKAIGLRALLTKAARDRVRGCTWGELANRILEVYRERGARF